MGGGALVILLRRATRFAFLLLLPLVAVDALSMIFGQVLIKPSDECFGGLVALFASKAVPGAFHHDEIAGNFFFFERGEYTIAVVRFYERIFVAMNQECRRVVVGDVQQRRN